MKHLSLIFPFFCLLIFHNIQAQQNHFIYLQTENKKPFYLKLSNEVYSSSLTGYLIVSKLKMGVYAFTIGFPKNEWPEQLIQCSVEDKDYGFLVKHFENNRWGFFNLQTQNILMCEEVEKIQAPPAESKTDVFSNMLSAVVNDPSIKEKDLVKIIEKKPIGNIVSQSPNVQISPLQNDTIFATAVDTRLKDISNDTLLSTVTTGQIHIIQKPLEENLSSIVKKKVKKTTSGTDFIYLVSFYEEVDTVEIFLPYLFL